MVQEEFCRVSILSWIWAGHGGSLEPQSLSLSLLLRFHCYSGYTAGQDAASGDLGCEDAVSAISGKTRVGKRWMCYQDTLNKLPSHTCTACQKGPVHSTLHITHTGGPQESWPDSDAVLSIYVQSKSDSDMKTGTDRKQLWSDLKWMVLPWYNCLCSYRINMINVFLIIWEKQR